VTFDEYARLGWWDKRRPAVLAAVWRTAGRDWALAGEQRRSEVCHRLADYYEQPLWMQVLLVDDVAALHRELDQMRRAAERAWCERT
jgi:hypothetical protein